jgi:hypothetical protein
VSSGPVVVPLFNLVCWHLEVCQFYHVSVAGDRPTIVKINGKVRVLTFEELFNMFADRAVRVANSDVVFVDDLEIYTLTPTAVVRNPEFYMTDKELQVYRMFLMGGLPKATAASLAGVARGVLYSALEKASSELHVVVGGWRKVKQIVRHRINKRMYRVMTKYGETVVTEDHSLIALVGGRLVEVKPLEMIEKHLTPARIHILEPDSETDVVDLWEWLTDGRACKALRVRCNRCGYEYINTGTGEKRCNRCSSRRVEVVGEVEYFNGFYLDGDTIRFVKSNFSMPRYLTGDTLKRFLMLVGAYVSEGSLGGERGGQKMVEIFNSDVEWLGELAEAARSLGLSATISRSSGDTYMLAIRSTPFKELIERLCGRHAENKKLPDFVLTLSREYVGVLLNNLIKGDGWREHRDKYSEEFREKHFRYFSKSRKLVAQLCYLLTKFGVKYSIWYNSRTGVYTIATVTKYWADSRSKLVVEEVPSPEYVYDLEVEGTHAFVDGIGLILLHNTQLIILPPYTDVLLQWAPAEDNVVQLIFALTFGTPRDFYTGETVYTTEAGFWHRGRGMKYHWDPLVESIMKTVYPHVTPATKREPFEIRLYNYTSRVLAMDVSVWVFEYHEDDYRRFLSMVRGFSKLLRLVDVALPDYIDRETALKTLAELFKAIKAG